MTGYSFKETDNSLSKRQKTPEKRLPVTAGMFAFLAVSLLMTFGLCKFSFYLLKNHRSAVTRDSLTQTYADIRPYGMDDTPNVYFANEKPLEYARPVAEAAPVETITPTVEETPVYMAKMERLAPTTATPVQTAAVLTVPADIKTTESVPEQKDISALVGESAALLDEIDTQLDTGKSLLTENDAIEEPVVTETTTVAVAETVPAAETAALIPETASRPQTVAATHWVDMNELRRRIKEKADAAIAKNDFKPATQMPNQKQFAALPDVSVADTQPVATESLKKTPVPKSEKTERKVETESSSSQKTAVVAKTDDAAVSPVAKKTARSLWKVSKVNGQDTVRPELKAQAGLTDIPPETAKTPSQTAASVETQQTASTAATPLPTEARAVFYKNGKIKKIIAQDGTAHDPVAEKEREEQDWLDKQEAAVWTNMSQSDTPSVWSFSSQNKRTDTARAFKVAETLPTIGMDEEAPIEPPAITEKTEVALPNEQTKDPPPAVSETPAPATPATPVAPAPVVSNSASGAPSEPATVQKPLIIPGTAPVPVTTTPKKPEPLLMSMAPKDDIPAQDADKNESSLTTKLFSLFSADNNKDSDPASVSAPAAQNTSTADIPVFPTNREGIKSKTQTVSKKDVASFLKTLSEKEKEETALPNEIRLTFRPQNADLSTNSVKLIQNFAKHAKKDIQARIEIRVSEADPDIQNKRFSIIRNVLTGAGVEETQILLSRTKRSPETLILRTFTVADEDYETESSWLNGTEERLYYKKW